MLRLIIIALCAHIGHCQLSQGSLERERDGESRNFGIIMAGIKYWPIHQLAAVVAPKLFSFYRSPELKFINLLPQIPFCSTNIVNFS